MIQDDDMNLLIYVRDMDLIAMIVQVDNNHNVDNMFEKQFYQFDLMIVVVLIVQVIDNHYPYIKKEVLLLLD